jgi:hypothetical protein
MQPDCEVGHSKYIRRTAWLARSKKWAICTPFEFAFEEAITRTKLNAYERKHRTKLCKQYETLATTPFNTLRKCTVVPPSCHIVRLPRNVDCL